MANHHAGTALKRRDFCQDDYETPTYVLDMILDQLSPTEWVIWEPFPGSSHSTNYMRKRGFEVTNGLHEDFFHHTEAPVVPDPNKKLVVVTNPPYSKKKQILQKFKVLGVHNLALFVPIGTLTCQYFKHSFPLDQNQLIVHKQRCRFINPLTHEPMKNDPPFDVVWITNGLNLSKDVQVVPRRTT